MSKKIKKTIVPDTSAIINGTITKITEESALDNDRLVIPIAVLDELQAQASKNRDSGFIGLKELKKIREECSERNIRFSYSGERPSLEDIRLAGSGRMDAIIRDVAKQHSGTLITSDFVQALVAEAEGVDVKYVPNEVKTSDLKFEGFFTDDTLSLHLKEGIPPMAKRGKPGGFKLEKIRDEPLSRDELETITGEVSEAVRVSEQGSIEIIRGGATVIQLGKYRVSIAKPFFSDALEITAVRPIVRLNLDDYEPSEQLLSRLRERADGILIAGSPGSGKTTFASSLANFYISQGKIVKTFESPRDMQVRPEITQYGPLDGEFEKTADFLLLVRPDYTIFDEVRKTKDFRVFSDLRLSGVGMIGVVHASKPVDAIQRFMGRVELGLVPHIIDTVIFVRDGEIKKIYALGLVVKVPTGMTEADLARPVVEIKEFESEKLEYEIYTYGEENIIIPVGDAKVKQDAVSKLAEDRIHQIVSRFDSNAEVNLVSPNKAIVRVERNVVPKIIGKGGVVISDLEDKLGLRIDVESKLPSIGAEVKFKTLEKGNSIEFMLDEVVIGKIVNVYVEDDYLLSATVGRKAKIRVSKKSDNGRKLINALIHGVRIKVLL